jgi:hypothetical protein
MRDETAARRAAGFLTCETLPRGEGEGVIFGKGPEDLVGGRWSFSAAAGRFYHFQAVFLAIFFCELVAPSDTFFDR